MTNLQKITNANKNFMVINENISNLRNDKTHGIFTAINYINLELKDETTSQLKTRKALKLVKSRILEKDATNETKRAFNIAFSFKFRNIEFNADKFNTSNGFTIANIENLIAYATAEEIANVETGADANAILKQYKTKISQVKSFDTSKRLNKVGK